MVLRRKGIVAMIRKGALSLALAGFSLGAHSASLLGNTIICDSPQDLSILKAPNMVGQTSRTIMNRVDASIGYYKSMSKLDTLKAQLATSEEANRNDAYLGGSSGGEVAHANEGISLNSSRLQRFLSFKRDCTINANAQTVTVLKIEPIQGIAEVSALVNGLRGDVWSSATAIRHK